MLGLALAARLLVSSGAPPTPNLVLVGAPEVWARGYVGQGVVVAVLDTGVDLNQPELASRWRGGANSWFDPYAEHPDQPIDLNGHGTQVLGVILAGQASGQAIGLAPGARWIAARVFNDRGRAATPAIHAALRWALDPDGDPASADAPQVLNASWSALDLACNPEFAADLRALRAAGILPVFAAGAASPVGPANLPEAFAVGALADGEHLFRDSPRGPSPCPDKENYPDLAAPGAGILTTDRNGLYSTLDGTSLAAAHVSGALALLLSAHPGLSAAQQAEALRAAAVDLGAPGPDDAFGAGRLNIARAVARVMQPAAAKPWLLLLALAGPLLALSWRLRRRPKTFIK